MLELKGTGVGRNTLSSCIGVHGGGWGSWTVRAQSVINTSNWASSQNVVTQGKD